MTRLITIDSPAIRGQEAVFSWSVTPSTSLYERTEFRLSFPDTVDLRGVPESLWWRLALLCLHPHWPLLRPCRVVLPVSLGPGEVESWLRLTDAAVASLEAHMGHQDMQRTIELVGTGPLLPLEPSEPMRGGSGLVSCFSGGRDSITQAAMLCELGETPTLVTVTSPVPWSNEHDTPRRRAVLDEISRRLSLEHVEVASDFRASWENSFVAERYEVSVNELTDTFLYIAVAIAVAAARGSRLVLMASEAEVQESFKLGGMVIQDRHFMYSAATHGAVAALLEPAGIGIASLTHGLWQFHVQRLLSERYSELRDLQYSCWELGMDEAACSRCGECRRIALNLVASDVSPAVAGIDLTKLLLAHSGWEPGRNLREPTAVGAPMPRRTLRDGHQMQELRCLADTSPEQVAALIDGTCPESDRKLAVQVYTRLRALARSFEIEPEPGYRAGYLELLDGDLREGVRSILDQHFLPAPPDSYKTTLANTRLLADWFSAPLRVRPERASSRRSSPGVQRRQAATLTDEEFALLGHLIPDPEPVLGHPRGGRLLRVAETLLDGSELAYLTECVEGNWISSAGSFVTRLEHAFAAAVGCRFAVACSSGTAALHLALAGVGIGSGDEVIVPAFTMIATANAALYVGADPVLIDADPTTWNLDPERIVDKLTRRTRALVAVHTYGQPADMDAILEVADRNGLVVIEDAAEAHGAQFAGQPVGSIGAVAAFSLYGNKIVTTGEGGVVTTNDERIADVARELRDHAFSRERHFWHRRVGFNYRMTNLQAAVGVAQVERLGTLLERRRLNAERYREALSGIDGLQFAPQLEGGVTWMFGIRVSDRFGVERDELRRRLAARGVETRTFFVPLHLQPVYHRRFAGQRYPVAEELGRTGLYLPSGPSLGPDDIAYIADAVRASRAESVASGQY